MTSHEMHKSSPVISSEFTPEEQALFSVAVLEDWRSMQHGVLTRLREEAGFSSDDYIQAFVDSVDDALGFYLNSHGVAEDSPKRDELTKLFRDASIDKISEDEWANRPSSRNETVSPDKDVSQKQVFAQKIGKAKANTDDSMTLDASMDGYDEAVKLNKRWDELNESVFAREKPDSADSDDIKGKLVHKNNGGSKKVERVETRTALTEAREKLAKLSTKRLFGGVSDEYLLAKQEYDDLVREFGKIQFSDSREMYDEMPDEAREHFKASATEYIFEEQAKLREATNNRLQSTRRGKIIKGIGDFMNRGNKATRVAKSVGASVAVAAVAGATLGVGAPLAVGAIAAGRGFMTYARRDKREVAGLSNKDKADIKNIVDQDSVGILDRGYDTALAQYAVDSKEYRKSRRKAAYFGIGTAALTLASGAFGHYVAEGVRHATHSVHGVIDHVDGNLGQHGASPSPKINPKLGSDLGIKAGIHHGVEQTPVGSGSGHSVLDYFSGHAGTTEFSAGGVHNFESWMNGAHGTGYTVKPGDTIWGLSQKYLEAHGVHHPSVYQTDAVKDQMVKVFQAKGIVSGPRDWLYTGQVIKF